MERSGAPCVPQDTDSTSSPHPNVRLQRSGGRTLNCQKRHRTVSAHETNLVCYETSVTVLLALQCCKHCQLFPGVISKKGVTAESSLGKISYYHSQEVYAPVPIVTMFGS